MKIEYGVQQAEMIYLAILNVLRDNDIPYDDKFEQLSDELLDRHEAIDLTDLLEELYHFIMRGNGFL